MNTNDNALKSLIDTENFKDALLASLYSQVEFLRTQIVEKDLLIRSLIIKESDIFNYESSRNVEVKNMVISNCRDVNVNESDDNILDNVNSTSPNKDRTTNLNETGDTDDELGDDTDDTELGDNTDDDVFFNRLYNEYMQCRNEELERQLKDVREQQHNLF